MPALDGLRGAAIMLVLVGHAAGAAGSHAATAGVTLFFALSGYLITGRLLSGQPLRRFYVNRALRLFPALVVMVLVTGTLFVGARWPWWWPIESLLYVRNVTAAHFGSSEMSPYNHTWSLALEEQFYLVWPLVLLTFLRRGRSPVPALLVVVATSLSALAWAVRAGWSEVANYSPATTIWPLALGCSAVLLGITPKWPNILSARGLRWFGDRSYGIYLWHMPLIFAFGVLDTEAMRGPAGCLAGVALGALSYRWVERPFLAMKDRMEDAEPSKGDRGLAVR